MTGTGRLSARKGLSKTRMALAGTPAEQIARQARVQELRQLVAAGRYRVEPNRLALKILVRALRTS